MDLPVLWVDVQCTGKPTTSTCWRTAWRSRPCTWRRSSSTSTSLPSWCRRRRGWVWLQTGRPILIIIIIIIIIIVLFEEPVYQVFVSHPRPPPEHSGPEQELQRQQLQAPVIGQQSPGLLKRHRLRDPLQLAHPHLQARYQDGRRRRVTSTLLLFLFLLTSFEAFLC